MYSIPVARFGRHKPLITQQHECQQLPQSARYLQGLRAAPGSGPWCRSCTPHGSTTFMQAVGSGGALDLWAAIKSPRGRLARGGSCQEQDTRAFPQLPELCVCCGQLLLDLNNCTGDKPRDTHTLSPFKADTCPRPATESIDLAEKNTPDSSDASTRMTIPSGGGAIPPQGVEVKQRRRETDSDVGWGHLVFFNESNHIS